MLTREQMISELTKYELVFLAEHPQWLSDTVEFFTKGGFSNWDDAKLTQQYLLKIAEEQT
jgi:hypothetical protein